MRRRAIPQQPAPFPKSVPPGLNYAVVTGTLISDPIKDKGPGGEPLTLLEIKFPVANPENPRLLWTYAYATVLVAGQLSQRPDRIDEQAAIVAILVKRGPCPEPSNPSQ